MATTRAGQGEQDSAPQERLPIGIPLAAAAVHLGLSVEATRKRAQRGTLTGYKFDGAWYVVLPNVQDGQAVAGRTVPTLDRDTVLPDGQDTGQDDGQDTIEAHYRVTPAAIEQAVSRPSAQYLGDLRTVLAEVGKVYEGRIAATEAASAAKDETIATQREALAELRRRAAAAEGERDALRLQLAEVSVPPVVVVAAQEAPEGAPTTIPIPTAAQGLWPRLRRALART